MEKTEYDIKLEKLSKSTMQIISDLITSWERVRQIHDIVMSCDTEEEIVQKLRELESEKTE